VRSESVYIPEYWHDRLEAWIKSGIRKSKAEIVQEGLKAIHRKLDEEMDAWLNFKAEPLEGVQELE